MTKILLWIKAHLVTVVVGILLSILILFLAPRACRTAGLEKDKAVLQGEIAVLKSNSAEKEKAYSAEKKELEKQIAARDETISIAQGNIDSLNGILNSTEEGIGILEDKLKDAKTAAERVPILEDIVKGYKVEVFNLKATIVEKDKQIFSLTANYKAEHKLRLDAEAGWDGEKVLTRKLSDEVKTGGKIISRLQAQLSLWKIPVKVLVVAGLVFGGLTIAK